MKQLLLSLALVLALAAGAAAAQPGAPRHLSEQDRQFVYWASESNEAAMELAALAEKKARNPAVKDFAKRDHDRRKKLGDKLAEIARSGGVSPAPHPDKDDEDLKKNLETVSGDEFDRLYVRSASAQGRKTSHLYEEEARTGSDPWLKGFVAKTLPELKKHDIEARKVAAQLSGTAPLMSPSGTVTMRHPRPGTFPHPNTVPQ